MKQKKKKVEISVQFQGEFSSLDFALICVIEKNHEILEGLYCKITVN